MSVCYDLHLRSATDRFVHSFEELVVFLRSKQVISFTKQALRRIHMVCTFRHGSPSRSISPENINVRVFLAAYMIAYRPGQVFETMGPLENALFDAAKPLLEKFEAIAR